MNKLKPNSMSEANFLSRIFYWWLNGFFATGSKKTLDETDMLELQNVDKSDELCARLERNWEKELQRREKSEKPSLCRAITKTYAAEMATAGIGGLVEEAVRTALPVLIAGLVRYFEERDATPAWAAYTYVTGIGLCSFAIALVHHQWFFWVQRVGWHLRAASCALMYKKTLRLSQMALNRTTTGQIVNLGATDVIRFDFLSTFLNYLWIGPIQIIALGIILWQEVGEAALVAIALLIVTMGIQFFNGRIFGKLRSMTAVLTDDRIRLMNEVISGIRIIKMYAWEKPFAKLVSEARRKEIKKILLSSGLKAFNVCIFLVQDKALTFFTLMTYVLIGGSLSASKIFLVASIFQTVKTTIGYIFPAALLFLYESLSSIKRIQEYLLLDEFSNLSKRGLKDGESYVRLENFTGKWASEDDDNGRNEITLSDITARVDSGQLLVVIGPVGSGKSSFLNAILGELPSISGNVYVNGEHVYANQIPWVFSGTIRENILFGNEFDPIWYNKVISACCLTKDLKSFAEADETLVGERGVTLSGGQKSRVNLARAAYRRGASICLLDDPLSAVDASVANHIFTQCISGLMKNKVRVLVTHQLQLIKSADKIIILKEGKMVGEGTYDELQAIGTDFASLLQREDEHKEKLGSEGDNHDEKVPDGYLHRFVKNSHIFASGRSKKSAEDGCQTPRIRAKHHFVRDSTARASSRSMVSVLSFDDPPLVLLYFALFLFLLYTVWVKFTSFWQNVKDTFADIEPEEVREQGSIGGKVYLEYFRIGTNAFFLTAFLFVVIASHVLYVMNDWWLAQWALQFEAFLHLSSLVYEASADEALSSNSTSLSATSPEDFDNSYYLYIYATICFTTMAVILLRSNMHFYLCVSSGIHMHNKMFRAILRAPVRFFDTNPVGRILNRFSKDTGQVDELLPVASMDFLFISGLIVCSVILVSVINYFVIIIVIPLAVYLIWLRRYYLRTSRDIKRLEGTCRSPVFSLLSSTLQGLVTVRSFGVQDKFEKRFHESQDLHSASWFLFLTGSRWFGLRLDLITAVFTSVAAFSCVLAASFVDINSGEVGLILIYSVSTIGLFQWGVRQSAEVENLMTSVERIQQYYSIQPEAPDEISEEKPHNDWPTHGAINFKNVSFAYFKDGPLVLKDLTLEIKQKEKIGLVGRTGAGKSSVISALFRLAELAHGEIYIDGVPISTIGLQDLRRVLSIIPQDPILFTGTMRRNLDPFDEYTDEDLWNALEQVQLYDFVKSLPIQLLTELSESGSNFSVGQRQLVCLARAILRKSKVLLIDEATANVDIRTDRLIQVTIREKFQQCTVITIAHRINTVIDSDRVLVLDDGRVKEFDDPYSLLQDKMGLFFNMVKSTGITEFKTLLVAAKNAYDLKQNSQTSIATN